MSPRSPAEAHLGAFGPNAWLVDDMFEQYRRDPGSVSESWQEFFADYRPAGGSARAPIVVGGGAGGSGGGAGAGPA
ncbi:MAG: 2-oxoglutarate dehydrogenase E1 subunit family protein, partial [Acidimicrobiales bacterium]